MLIQAIGTFTFEGEGQKSPLIIGDGEFADIPNGAAQQALQQGTARAATMDEVRASQSKETPAAAPVRPMRGKRFNSAGEE